MASCRSRHLSWEGFGLSSPGTVRLGRRGPAAVLAETADGGPDLGGPALEDGANGTRHEPQAGIAASASMSPPVEQGPHPNALGCVPRPRPVSCRIVFYPVNRLPPQLWVADLARSQYGGDCL